MWGNPYYSGFRPIPGVPVIIHHFVVGGIFWRGVVVGEFAGSGEADEDALGSSVGLESEGGAPIVEQIKFHVAAPAVELEFLVCLVAGGVLAFFHQGEIGGDEGFGQLDDHVEISPDVAAVVIIKKNAPNAPPLSFSVFVAEISVAIGGPGFPGTEGLAGLFPCAVEMAEVLFVGVVGGQVGASSEPVFFPRMDHAEIGVDGGNAGVFGMEDDGDACGPERRTGGADFGNKLFVHLAMD